MNKRLRRLLVFAGLILFLVFMLNLKVYYYRGIDYKVSKVEIPLYLKAIDFFSRHYHYRLLAKDITSGYGNEEGKVLALFSWAHENIRNVPAGFPVIDDHVWNIIVRGYGSDDQVADVFATLCNYAGTKAFFTWVNSKDTNKRIPLSFVKIRRKWFIFDPFNGVYFKEKTGNLADIDKVKSGNYVAVSLEGETSGYHPAYIPNLVSIKRIDLTRSNIQSPFNRLIFELKNKFKKGE